VPLVKHSRDTAIKDVKIRLVEPWQDRIFRQLEHYKKKAPFYNDVIDFLQNALSYKTDNITDLDAHLLAETCQYIGISFHREVFSEMHLPIEEVTAVDEWALNICRSLNADTYINPPGGLGLFSGNKYAQADITLQFLEINLRPYKQKDDSFVEGLSILDVMMFNTPQEIQTMLDDYRLL
jgi:hypothetical protein